jgi:hypothetical protein
MIKVRVKIEISDSYRRILDHGMVLGGMKKSSVQSILVCSLMQLGDGDGREEGGGGGWQESGEVARSTHFYQKGHNH